jgi:hypothetical protein
MERQLREDELLKTGERLGRRIAERLPGSGLTRVAAEVVQLIREALVRAAAIRRPNYWLRGGLVVLGLLLVLGLWLALASHDATETTWGRLLKAFDATKGIAVYLVAIAIFFITLEVRWKRRKALRAVHELRAMAHLIDMHQLAKDPDRLGEPDGPTTGGQPMSAETMGRYLHYCTELLALVSKIGHLYVQDFPDATALAAVDQCEGLATGLSQKIWQKIMVLDRIRADTEPAAGGNGPAPVGPIVMAAPVGTPVT